jgi:hypothetical protein
VWVNQSTIRRIAMLSEVASKVFEALPDDGSPVSGIRLKGELEIGSAALREAKQELQEHKLITLGRGRGGTVLRVPGAEPPADTRLSKSEIMANAREAKQTKQRAERELDEIKARVVAVGKSRHPDADEIVPGLFEGRWYCEVWERHVATMDFFPTALLNFYR